MQCIRVDFPDPDGPMIAVKRPRGIPTVTPSSATTRASPCPYTFAIRWVRAAKSPGPGTVDAPAVDGAVFVT